jgi:hypothetical protein
VKSIIFGIFIALTGCAGTIPVVSTDPAVTARIVAVCTDSGLFKVINGTVAAFVPQATLPVALVNAGIDQVCTHPETFAADASTVEWLIKNFASVKS